MEPPHEKELQVIYICMWGKKESFAKTPELSQRELRNFVIDALPPTLLCVNVYFHYTRPHLLELAAMPKKIYRDKCKCWCANAAFYAWRVTEKGKEDLGEGRQAGSGEIFNVILMDIRD